MRDRDDLGERGHPARDVGRTGDGEQPGRRALAERGRDLGGAEGPVRPALHVPASSCPGPGQHVRVVLGHGGDNYIVPGQPQPVSEVIEGLGSVAAQDRHITGGRLSRQAGSPPRKGERGRPGLLIRRRGELGLVTGPAMHAGVPGDEPVDPSQHRLQSRVRGRSVKRQRRTLGTVRTADREPVTDQWYGQDDGLAGSPGAGVLHGGLLTAGRSAPGAAGGGGHQPLPIAYPHGYRQRPGRHYSGLYRAHAEPAGRRHRGRDE